MDVCCHGSVSPVVDTPLGSGAECPATAADSFSHMGVWVMNTGVVEPAPFPLTQEEMVYRHREEYRAAGVKTLRDCARFWRARGDAACQQRFDEIKRFDKAVQSGMASTSREFRRDADFEEYAVWFGFSDDYFQKTFGGFRSSVDGKMGDALL